MLSKHIYAAPSRGTDVFFDRVFIVSLITWVGSITFVLWKLHGVFQQAQQDMKAKDRMEKNRNGKKNKDVDEKENEDKDESKKTPTELDRDPYHRGARSILPGFQLYRNRL